jgi:hypothetical protein
MKCLHRSSLLKLVQSMMAGFALLAMGAGPIAGAAETNYLGDEPELIQSCTQGWGKLGFDVAADGSPLQMGGRTYSTGLGHHANGSIVVTLDGHYSAFDAEVGIQKQKTDFGSVVFRVLVDGKDAFHSGTVRQRDGVLPVHVDVGGAREMVLETTDAGDGISCDMGNWVEARLTRLASASAPPPETLPDMARFGRIASWDPNRTNGCRSLRAQEFDAEDLFPETNVLPNADGSWTAPVSSNGLSCIGLQWLNQHTLQELALRFAGPAAPPPPSRVRVEFWAGESAWQGQWLPLRGAPTVTGDRYTWQFAPRANGGLVQTRKVRWIFSADANPVKIRALAAYTRSRWDMITLHVEMEHPSPGENQVEVCDGELADGKIQMVWNPAKPLSLPVRYSRPSAIASDLTTVRFLLPSGAVVVEVADVLKDGCVYLPDAGLFIAREPVETSLAEYRRKVAGRKTVLQRVREMPDQTFEQAMAKTHDAIQDGGPVLLSLACDNAKFVVEREGQVEFEAAEPTGKDRDNVDNWFITQGQIWPRFGTGKNDRLERHLDGGWLPVPVISVEKDGVLYTQRTFVAPCDPPGEDPARWNRRSVCVIEFVATNTQAVPVHAKFGVAFLRDMNGKKTAHLVQNGRDYNALQGNRRLALLRASQAGPLKAEAEDGTVTFAGDLPSGGSARWTVYLPGTGFPPGELASLDSTESLRAAVATYWQAAMAQAMQIEIPDPLLYNVIYSSRVRCLIDARSEAGGSRVAVWTAAMVYGPLESESHSVIRGMDFMGHEEFARRGLDYFVHRYNAAGFLTTGYTTFGTGWHLWTLGEHYQLDQDSDWMRQVGPEVARVGEWVIRQTEKTKKLDPSGQPRPEYGLMPPGVLADWDAFAYHFCMNAYYDAGLRDAGAALEAVHNPKGKELVQAAAELRRNLIRAYRWTQSQTPAWPLQNGAWVAGYPSQLHSPGKLEDFFPGQDGGRSGRCYDVELGAQQMVPTKVLDANSREVTEMLDQMEDVQFLTDGWVNYPAEKSRRDWFDLGGFSKTQPYYTRNAEIYAMRDEVKPFLRSYFNTIAAMVNPEVLTIWEGLAAFASGAFDKTHETGYFLQQTRSMLVMEHGDELWLAPLITSNWLKDGMTVAVSNAPTFFGKVSYQIHSHVNDGYIEANIYPPTRQTPKYLVLRLRHPEGKPAVAVLANGKPCAGFDPKKEIIRLAPDGAIPLVVRATY